MAFQGFLVHDTQKCVSAFYDRRSGMGSRVLREVEVLLGVLFQRAHDVEPSQKTPLTIYRVFVGQAPQQDWSSSSW